MKNKIETKINEWKSFYKREHKIITSNALDISLITQVQRILIIQMHEFFQEIITLDIPTSIADSKIMKFYFKNAFEAIYNPENNGEKNSSNIISSFSVLKWLSGDLPKEISITPLKKYTKQEMQYHIQEYW